MVTLRRCRELLGQNCLLSEAELERLRDQLVALADIAICEARQFRGHQAENALYGALRHVKPAQRGEIAGLATMTNIHGELQDANATTTAARSNGNGNSN